MSVALRGILCIIAIIIPLLELFRLSYKGVSLKRLSASFILSIAWFAPIIDLGFSPFGFPIVPFTTLSLVYLFIARSTFQLIPRNIKVGIIGLLGVYIISAVFSHYPVPSLIASIVRISPIAVFVAIWILLESNENKVIDKAIIIFSFYVIVWGIIQQFISRDFTLYYLNRIEEIRLVSIFFEPQTAGCGIAMLAIYFFNRYKATRQRFFVIMMIALVILGALTGSKTFLIGILLGIAVSMLFFKVSPTIIMSLLLTTALIYATQDYWLQLPVFERMKEMSSSYDFRSTIFWAAGWNIFIDNWLSGIGIGNFLEYNANTLKLEYPNGEIASQPESGYLLLLDEVGILSIYYIFIIIYIVIRKGYRYYNIGLIIPWLIAFVSVYNLESCHIQFLLYAFIAMIMYSSEYHKNTSIKIAPNENINSRKSSYSPHFNGK